MSLQEVRVVRKCVGAAFLLCLIACGALQAGDRDVIFNEIHYNPAGGDGGADLEFFELQNLGGEPVDLSGWRLSDGVSFTFPPGTSIGPREHVIVSPDPVAAGAAYGLSKVLGPYSGRLDNGGEILELRDARGHFVNRVHYDDEGAWPSLPDGLGPSLEFMGTDNANDIPTRWGRSFVLGGTPGAPNSRQEAPPDLSSGSVRSLISRGSVWRTFAGTTNPSSPLDAWTQPGFNDAAWPQNPGGFGFGNGVGFPVATQVGSPGQRPQTYYIRGRLFLDAEAAAGVLAGELRPILEVAYDDAFVAYVNGVEVARRNIGQPGQLVPNNAVANGSENEEVRRAISAGPFAEGENVLALVGVNTGGGGFGRDFYIDAGLELEEVQTGPVEEDDDGDPLLRGLLNEVSPGGVGPTSGFIELHNERAAARDIGGHVLRLAGGTSSYTFPPVSSLPSGAFLAVTASMLGFDIPANVETVLLLGADGKSIVDVLDVRYPPAGRSSGRYPDGGEDAFVLAGPTPGAPNTLAPAPLVVISELQYHPAFVAPAGGCLVHCSDVDQWIELWNASGGPVSLDGWSLTKGIRFDFPPGLSLAADAHLVVAGDLARFTAMHPGVSNVVGSWSGRLSHGGETVRLLDALGNQVDRVEYGDGGPTNDEAPADGVDDRTFRGSLWPLGADGTGRTIELVHPALDNHGGLAWRASVSVGGTPGAPNSVAESAPAPAVRRIDHSPAVPRSTEPVVVTCKISSANPLTAADVEWSLDGGGGQGTVPLRDDGDAPDERAGDGSYAATIPPQADGRLVRFRIHVTDTGSQSSVVPLAPAVSPYNGFPGVFYLYEVDDTPAPSNGSPVYRILMTQADLNELDGRRVDSNVLLPGTFIAGKEVHSTVGVRYRGESSRNEANRSYKVAFHADDIFEGVDRINLNGSNGGGLASSAVNEILAADLFRRAGEPVFQAYSVNLHFPGEVSRDFDARYVRKEDVDDLFLARAFGGSDEGNLYRPRNPGGVGQPSGDLRYLGESKESYRDLYEKKNNKEEDDFYDIIELTRAFDPAQTPQGVFVDTLSDLIDAREWAEYFAIEALLTNDDGGIWNNNGEDYFLYRVPEDSPRPDAGKFLILAWDVEETFNSATRILFEPVVPSIRRFLTAPPFAKLYYQELCRLQQGPFSRLEMRERFGFVSRMFPVGDVFNVVDPIESNITDRLGYLASSLEKRLTVGPESEAVSGTEVVSLGDIWRFFRGRSAPSVGPFEWADPDFDDSLWEEGPTGIGYGDGDDATVLDDMLNSYTTVFARTTFNVVDASLVGQATLVVDYDDAFVAYLNGVEVARSPSAPGSPGDPVSFNSPSGGNHEAGTDETFPLALAPGLLRSGDNVLAMVALNDGADSSDLSLRPTLFLSVSASGSGIAGGCGGPIYATGGEAHLSGQVDPGAGSVRVNGVLADLQVIVGGAGPYGARWSAVVPLAPGDNATRITSHADEAGAGAPLETLDVVVHRLARDLVPVGGTLAADTVWTAAGGPYRLTGDVTVPAGRSLTIEAGAIILGDGGAGLRVQGLLEVLGTPEAEVRLGSMSCASLWGGILVNGTGTQAGAPVHILRNAVLEHARSLESTAGVIDVRNSRILIEDSVFRSFSANGLDGSASEVEVRRSRFEDLSEGIHCANSLATIEDCVFLDLIGDNDAIDFDGATGGRSRIARCTIDTGADDGLDLAGASVDIVDCVIARVGDKGISLEDNGPSGPVRLQGTRIFGCGTGIAVKNGAHLEGDHDTITSCQEGLALFPKDNDPDGGHGVFHSMIIWGNGIDVVLGLRSTVELADSDAGPEVWPGEGNIYAPPLFVSQAAGDLRLLAGSPCIGTGQAGSDMGALPFGPGPGVTFLRGDTNESGQVDISDPVSTLRYLFLGGSGPSCFDLMDADDDGSITLTDAVYTLRFLFQGGPTVLPPYPEAGVDPTEDSLPCDP